MLAPSKEILPQLSCSAIGYPDTIYSCRGRAADGTLSIFASGDDAHLANVRSILECLSAKLYTVPGGLGGGSNTKLIHQVFAGINIAMASEAMGLAAAAGFNTRQAFEELRASDGNSWMFENRVPHMLNPELPPYSAITIIAKDVVRGLPGQASGLYLVVTFVM